MTTLPRLHWSIRAAHRWGTDARLRRRTGLAVALVLIGLAVGLPWAAPVAEDHARERELAVAVESARAEAQRADEALAAYAALLSRRRAADCNVVISGADLSAIDAARAALERMR